MKLGAGGEDSTPNLTNLKQRMLIGMSDRRDHEYWILLLSKGLYKPW